MYYKNHVEKCAICNKVMAIGDKYLYTDYATICDNLDCYMEHASRVLGVKHDEYEIRKAEYPEMIDPRYYTPPKKWGDDL